MTKQTIGQLKRNLKLARQTAATRQIADLRCKAEEALSHPSASKRASIYLFGSWATGRFDGESDVDLLVIAPTKKESEDIQGRLMSFADDVVAYTAATWTSRYEKGDPFVQRVASERLYLAGQKGGDNERVR